MQHSLPAAALSTQFVYSHVLICATLDPAGTASSMCHCICRNNHGYAQWWWERLNECYRWTCPPSYRETPLKGTKETCTWAEKVSLNEQSLGSHFSRIMMYITMQPISSQFRDSSVQRLMSKSQQLCALSTAVLLRYLLHYRSSCATESCVQCILRTPFGNGPWESCLCDAKQINVLWRFERHWKLASRHMQTRHLQSVIQRFLLCVVFWLVCFLFEQLYCAIGIFPTGVPAGSPSHGGESAG